MSNSKMLPKLNIAIAGSTAFSAQATQALIFHPNRQFQITSILTPAPKPVGRHQTLASNPMHQLAIDQQIPHLLVNRPLKHFQQQIVDLLQPAIDILLVVDFGYLIPQWLLDMPQLATINIHPSKLPEWRGSSPGQCVLLSGSQSSAVTIMQLDSQLDHGPILDQIEFSVADDWTALDYYQRAFHLACNRLPQVVLDLANKTLNPKPQPDTSPTPLALLLTKNDGFISFSSIQYLIKGDRAEDAVTLNLFQGPSGQSNMHISGSSTSENTSTSLSYQPTHLLSTTQSSNQPTSLLSDLYPIFCHNRQLDLNQPNSLATYLSQATRALVPWPSLWTEIPTKKGFKAMKIHSCHWNANNNRLELEKVQISGQQPALWNQVKNVIVDN